MSSCPNKGERGIALLSVLFALLLLTVLGLGMIYSTTTETSINSNYRDKQDAFYAAMAGLQEARDRIQPATHNIVAPTALPSLAAANVIYIVSDASTVKPWLPGNDYFDSELCQEKVLNLTGTFGVPCTTIPSGTSWFQVIDDSLSSSAPWNLSYPLHWKWTRITLKGNNMTPVAVNGNSTIPAQTCWTGANQMSTPLGYTTGCQPIGGVTAVSVVTHGTGYTSAPTVAFSGGDGTGATATAVIAAETTGYISGASVTAGGSGYTTAPTVSFSSGAATATAVLAGTGTTTTTDGSVTSVAVTNGGSLYTSAPSVTFGGPGSGALATAVLSGSGTLTHAGFVSAVSLTAGGSLYTSAPTVGFSTGNASATSTLSTAGAVKTIAVNSVGTQCYSQASDVQIAFSGGGGSGATATATLEGARSCIYSLTVTASPQCTNKLDAGNGYSPIDQKSGVTLQSGNKSFSGTLFVSSANDKSPTSFSVQNPGYDSGGYSGSTVVSQVQLTGGAWADCGNITATATTGYRLASINVTANGSGYTSTPTVTITGGVGSTSNPTATVTRGFPVGAVTLTSNGTGYAFAPTVSFSGGGGSGAAANATAVINDITTYPVASINVTNGGNGYTSAPSVTLSGGGGSGAAGTAGVAVVMTTTYPVASITIDNGGSGYDTASPPTITISGGGGVNATATATVSTHATGNNFVDHIDVTAPGTGYTSNPTVTISGGGGTTVATATSQVSGGTKYGSVWLLTSMAQTKTGARSMLQMEVASPVIGFALGGALTLDGPNPIIDAMPNSNSFYVRGNDLNSCHDAVTEPPHPAIDGYDDPNANPPTNSVSTIIASLPRPTHYLGGGGIPSIENGYASLGETMTTPNGLQSVLGGFYSITPVSSRYPAAGSFTSSAASHTTPSSITYVDGDLTLSGNPNGSGILVVTGTLTMTGDFTWNGLVVVIGDGIANMSGGGNANVTGSMIVSKIWDNHTTKNLLSTIGSPTFNWHGGGGNGIQYDHCLATSLSTALPPLTYVSTNSLKILSVRTLP